LIERQILIVPQLHPPHILVLLFLKNKQQLGPEYEPASTPEPVAINLFKDAVSKLPNESNPID
jgi:hypothetical protein